MNANTALKINDAIDQAIRCGESVEDVQRQVRNALARAIEQRAADQLKLVEERTPDSRPPEGWEFRPSYERPS